MFAIRLPDKMEKRLVRMAKITGRTKSSCLREAIDEKLGDLEALYLVESRLADIDAGRVQPIPLEEALRQRGL